MCVPGPGIPRERFFESVIWKLGKARKAVQLSYLNEVQNRFHLASRSQVCQSLLVVLQLTAFLHRDPENYSRPQCFVFFFFLAAESPDFASSRSVTEPPHHTSTSPPLRPHVLGRTRSCHVMSCVRSQSIQQWAAAGGPARPPPENQRYVQTDTTPAQRKTRIDILTDMDRITTE